jgi:malate dehydrogenase (oxaloacetate-decarboxylating)(NADP+)
MTSPLRPLSASFHSQGETHHAPEINSPPALGAMLLHDPKLNKGTAFSEAERDQLGLRGLLPPRVQTPQQQTQRVMENIRRKENDLEKYVFLTALQDRNETLFYRVLISHLEELMPIVYTPTVGQACKEYAHIFRRARGLYLSLHDKGRMKNVLRNWPESQVRVIVVTDGSRILGLGDLGANGMGIPVGKLALYSACAGIAPSACLPITLDFGTDNEEFLNDPLYLGLPEKRVRGDEYDQLIEEFVQAVHEVFPRVLLQWEDFSNSNALRILATYRDRICSFNDDVQGTAAVALAGILSALRITQKPMREQTILFLGAGSAGTGIADLCVDAMMREGLSQSQARRRCWLVDSQGLVVASRGETLAAHKKPYAHEYSYLPDLTSAVENLKPTALIGVSGQPGTFTPEILQLMARFNPRPIVFALSNPTSKSECTAREAYEYSQSRAIFASGSPFAPVEYNGRTLFPAQGNNAYVFPGIGLGIIASQSARVTDEMFYAAAQALAGCLTDEELAQGRIYPPLPRIREISAIIATAVAETAYQQNLARAPRPQNLHDFICHQMYDAEYLPYA